MDQHEFDRAVSSPNFVEAAEAMKSLEGVPLIEQAAISGSVLLLRYLFTAPAWMRSRHMAFDLLGKSLMDRAGYLEYCITVDLDSEEVPKSLATYRLSSQINDAFWGCKWSELDMVNAQRE